eukprot:132423-Hanusia_phi.AAC.1
MNHCVISGRARYDGRLEVTAGTGCRSATGHRRGPCHPAGGTVPGTPGPSILPYLTRCQTLRVWPGGPGRRAGRV